MRRKPFFIIIFSVIALTAISSIIFVKISLAGDTTAIDSDAFPVSSVSSGSLAIDDSDNNDFTYIPPTLENAYGIDPVVMAEVGLEEIEEPFVPDTEMDLDPTSLTVFVNKEHALLKSYKPTDLVQVKVIFNLITYDERTYMRSEAAAALEKLFAAAKRDGYLLYGISGYRSYERQTKIFTNNIVNKGKNYTLRYSAVPGTSEHQTGLAIDVSAKSLNFKLTDNFASSKEGIWLAKNAHLYGYIIRYPKGKAEITGYSYEPWHIRYVGKGLATYLYTNQLTLDEYYKYTPSKDFDFEALYADLINYIPPNPTIIPAEGDGVIIGENGEIIEDETSAENTPANEDPDNATEDTAPDKEKPEVPEEPSDLQPTQMPTQKPTPDDSQPEEGEEDTGSEGDETPTDSETDGAVTTPVPTPTPPAPIDGSTSSTEETSASTNSASNHSNPTATPSPEDVFTSNVNTN